MNVSMYECMVTLSEAPRMPPHPCGVWDPSSPCGVVGCGVLRLGVLLNLLSFGFMV